MKFKDNVFYKAYELKKNSDDFEPKRRVDSSSDTSRVFYDLDVGMSVILARLLEIDTTYKSWGYCVGINFNKNIDKNIVIDYDLRRRLEMEECFPEKALEILKNLDLKDVSSISIVLDGEYSYRSQTFYINCKRGEIEEFKTYYNKNTNNLY